MADEVTFIGADDISEVNGALNRVISENFEGVELIEVKYFMQYGTPTVELLIWKKDGITLNDCEAVHNVVSEVLDRYDSAFKTAYNLNVSSLGLDRKIVLDDDYRRALGTEIECIDSAKKKTHGILESYDMENVVLTSGSKKINLKRNNLTKVQPYVRF